MTVKNMPIGALGDALKASDIADTRYRPITTFCGEERTLFTLPQCGVTRFRGIRRSTCNDIHPSTSQSIATTGRTRAKEAKL